MLKKLILTIFLLALMPAAVLAHQPRLASGVELMAVEKPEVSKAYYGVLAGEPAYYQIVSGKDFKFYVNILVPDLPDSGKDFIVRVFEGDLSQEPFLVLDGQTYNWEKYYEEYAGDDYLKGPEYLAELKAGTYTIEVTSPDNQGKYVLAIGEKEEFGLVQGLESMVLLPILKMNFFKKSPFMLFYSVLGQWLVIALVVILAVTFFLVLLIGLLNKRKAKKSVHKNK